MISFAERGKYGIEPHKKPPKIISKRESQLFFVNYPRVQWALHRLRHDDVGGLGNPEILPFIGAFH